MAYDTPDPRHVQPWLEAGLAAHRAGEIDRALDAYRHVLVLAPEHGAAHGLLGTGLLQLGRAGEALVHLEHAARRQRGDANVLGNLAQAYLALGRYAEAGEAFRKASRLAPAAVQLHVGTAAALALQGKLGEAEALLARLAARFPDAPLVWLNRGHVFRDTGRQEAALEAYAKALALDPALVDARMSLGNVLHTMMRFAEAEPHYRACLAAAPDHLAVRYNLASLLMDCGRFAEAEAVCGELVARAPRDSEAHRLLGTALARGRRLLGALAAYRRAAELAPQNAAAALSYGGALMEAGSAAEGLRWLRRASAADPESEALRRVWCGALLAHGCLQDGWAEHVCRPGAGALRAAHAAWTPGEPLNPGLESAHVCVIGEQGLGDELFFLRYAPALEALAARLTIRVSPRLVPLLERVPHLGSVLPLETPVTDADVRILCGDLPLALGALPSSALPPAPGAAALRDYPRHVALYWPPPPPALRIAPLPERLAALRARLSALGPPPYVGLTWRAGVAPAEQSAQSVLYKSIEPAMLARALEGVSATYVSLQRRPLAGETEDLSRALGSTAHDLSALNDDLESMLALLALLDEYIGVSNTNVHLRAAAGRTTRVLVPVPAEWRWMQAGRASPWFPGSCVYRQSLQGDWAAALAALARDLALNYGGTAPSNGAP